MKFHINSTVSLSAVITFIFIILFIGHAAVNNRAKKGTAPNSSTLAEITPEHEYFIGRAVAATIFESYQPYTNQSATHYVNLVGQSLAQASDRPETFGGYHFLILDTDEINAFAAPGGLIMVTRGLVRCCTSEDALAAVLAHEIGHIEKQHGLKLIKKSRLNSVVALLAAGGTKNLSKTDRATLTNDFEGSISDIASTMMKKGYDRTFETDADKSAVVIMKRVGYDPLALVEMLQQVTKNSKSGTKGFAKNHPDPQVRIKAIKSELGSSLDGAPPKARNQRFLKEMRGI